MKRDIEQIKTIKKDREKQQGLLNDLANKQNKVILSYSFLPDLKKQVVSCFLEALETYDEETPSAFPIYFSQKLNRTLKQKTNDFIEEKQTSLSPTTLRYIALYLYPLSSNTYVNRMQIVELLGANATVFANDELLRLLEHDTESILHVFPKYKELIKRKKDVQRGIVSQSKEKQALTTEEIELLKLYLGVQDDICKDVEEIAKLKKTLNTTVQTTLKNAFKKLESYSETKKQFLLDYPESADVYNIRMKKIYRPRKTVKKDEIQEQNVFKTTLVKEETPKKEQKQERPKTEQKIVLPKAEGPSFLEVVPFKEGLKEQIQEKKTEEKKKNPVKKQETLPIKKEPIQKKKQRQRKIKTQEELRLEEEKQAEKARKANERKEKKEQLFLTILEALLKQDEHGYQRTWGQVARELLPLPRNIYNYIKPIHAFVSQEQNQERIKKRIPNFDALWKLYHDCQMEDTLSKHQIKILELKNNLDENHQPNIRTNEEVAKLLSENGLSFDAFYVEANLYKISKYLYEHQDILQKVQQQYPYYKIYFGKPRERTNKQDPTVQELEVLKTMLEQDEHGFLRTQDACAKKLGISHTTLRYHAKKIAQLIQNEEYHQEVCKEIENFDTLWEFYQDCNVKKQLSKIQEKIIEEFIYTQENGKIKYRTNEEIAERISTDILHFDEKFVKAQKNKIYASKSKYGTNSPSYFSREDINLLRKRYQREKNEQFVDLTPEEVLLLGKLQSKEAQKKLNLKYPQLSEDYYIYWNHQEMLEREKEEKNNDIEHLEVNVPYFKSLLDICNENHKEAILYRMGYIDNTIHTTDETVKQCKLTLAEVNLLTTLCVNASKEQIQENVIQKVLKKYKDQ